MRLLRMMVPVVMAFTLIAGMTSVATAQDVPEASPEAGQVPEGLQRWYSRSFGADLFAMVDPASPEAMPTGWFLMSTNVLVFETEEQASAGVDELLAELEGDLASEDIQMEDIELDLGDLAYTARAGEVVEEDFTSVVIEVVAQDGEYVYAILGITLGADPAPLTETAVQAMQEGDASGEESFSQDGTSEGGLWSKLPSAETIQAEESSLTIVEDTVFYPAPEPEATPSP